MSVKNLRSSSMDALWSCAACVLAEGPTLIRIKIACPAAELGKACHEAGASLALTGSYDIFAACEHQGIEGQAVEDAAKLMGYARVAWKELQRYFPTPTAEASVEGPILKVGDKEFQVRGTLDLGSPTTDGRGAIFLDWKSGFVDDGFYQQMASYAYLLWCHMGRPSDIHITGVVVFLRHRYYRVLKYDATSISQWEHDLVHNILPSPDKYSPGKPCRFCDLFASCAARQAIAIGTVTEILGGTTEGPDGADAGWFERAKSVLAQLTPDNKSEPVVGDVLSDVLFRIRLLTQLIDQAKGVLRDAVTRVGPIPLGHDEALGLREVEVKKLKPKLAMSVLRNYMSDTQMACCMRLSLPKVLEAYANGETRGTRKGARQRLLDILMDAGAISVTVQQRLETMDMRDPETGEPDDEPNKQSIDGQGGEVGGDGECPGASDTE